MALGICNETTVGDGESQQDQGWSCRSLPSTSGKQEVWRERKKSTLSTVEAGNKTEVWRYIKHDLPEATCKILIDSAKASKDKEVCGFILSDGSVVSVTNVDPNPHKGFEMDKSEMMAVIKGNKPIVATYHSHPSGYKWPSEEDGNNVSFLYKQGCPWRYLIVTAHGVFEFEHRDKS